MKQSKQETRTHQNTHSESGKSEQKKAESTAPESDVTKNEASEAEGQTEHTKSDAEGQTELTEMELLQQKMDELQARYDQLNDSHLRCLAEFDNYRKRTLKEKTELLKTGGEKVLVDVLSIADDMERGLAAVQNTEDVAAVKEGMNLIYSKLQSFLKHHGIVEIETSGKPFDTDLHEAITVFPAPSEDLKGKVVDCVQKGYTLHEKVIRFAKVVVGE